MTKLWGPLGWMTLHSVSLIYPEQPTQAEKMIASRFLDLFADTISCNACKLHFKSILTIYKHLHPDFLNSRQNFAIFVFRAHNTVNKRLDKPIPSTVAACLATLKQATSQTSLAQFRTAYISYLYRNWRREFTGEGMMIVANVKELDKINNEYWSPREIPIPDLVEADVVSPIEKTNSRISPSGNLSSTKVGFIGGKLKLTRR